MSKDYENDEPIIEVTATPVGGEPKTQHFPFSTESATISGSTVPQVAGKQPDQAIQVAAQFLDYLKGSFNVEEYDLVVKFTEKEEIDRGCFSHMDLSLGGTFKFTGGTWEGKIKGTPKKEKRTKETTVRVGLEKKG